MEIVNKLKSGEILKILEYRFIEDCNGNHPRSYFVAYTHISYDNFGGCNPGTYYFLHTKCKTNTTVVEREINNFCPACNNKATYTISLDNKIFDNVFTFDELKFILDMELKREFITKKGNKVELIGVEKIEDNYYFAIKVNGEHIKEEVFTEESLLKIMAQ